MGYEWHAMFRQTPANGSVVIVDTHTAFTELAGPENLKVSYELDQRQRDDINRSGRASVFGFRRKVRMRVWTSAMEDSAHLFDIVNRLARTGIDWTTELSINGGGLYQQVEIDRSFTGPDALGGKPVAGAHFELALRNTDLLPEVPYIGDVLVPLPSAGGTSLPPAGPGYRWVIWTVAGTGTPDVSYQCLGDGSGGYSWIPFASG